MKTENFTKAFPIKTTYDKKAKMYVSTTVDCPILLYGVGDTEKDATDDLLVSIQEALLDIKENKNKLGPLMLEFIHWAKQFVVELSDSNYN